MKRRARQESDPKPFFDENEDTAAELPATESVTFTSFTVSPSKRSRTRQRVTRHEVPFAPTLAQPTQPASTQALEDDAPLGDLDMNTAEDGPIESNVVYIEEDDVPASRRSHVSLFTHSCCPGSFYLDVRRSYTETGLTRSIHTRHSYHTATSS